ncbi:MAG: threonine dehydratase, partial [Capnocytophaga sp.]|nr:threonine dehydratase [Capnocytophaga sp.]
RDKEVLITVETNGTDHVQALVEAFAAKGYEVTAK